MKNKVILIRNVEVAQRFAKKLRVNNIPFATVEAEYGEVCIEGSHQTLAHHTEIYKNYPAPCIRQDVLPLNQGIILISHIDLDTIGGIMLLEGERDMTHSFWQSEALIDTTGVLAEPFLSEKDKKLMQTYWSWEKSLPDQSFLVNQEHLILDVTDSIFLRISFINMMLKPSHTKEEMSYLTTYQQLFQQDLNEFLSTCVYEDERLRVFISQGNQHYLSHLKNKREFEDNHSLVEVTEENLTRFFIPTCVTFNTEKNFLIISDVTKSFDCKSFMQEVFGEQAGGQHRVAGSPRNEVMTINDLNYLLEKLYQKKGWNDFEKLKNICFSNEKKVSKNVRYNQ